MSLHSRAVAAPRPGIRELAAKDRLLAAARRVNLGLLAITAGASLFGAYYTIKVSQWVVMSDELQYSKLALSIGDTLSPVPVIHGAYAASLAQLYPLLIAPIMHGYDMPTAFRAAHVLNAVLMASTAIPAYLLTREVVGSRAAAYLVAALTVSVPWMVMSTMLLTEVAGYPAFVWSILLLQRSLARPGPKSDLAAIGGLALAFLARTQFVLLAPVFALTLFVHEIGWSVVRERLSPVVAVRVGAARALRTHRVLTWSGAVIALLAVPAALGGSLGRVLGRYQTTVDQGNFLPHGILRAVALHLDFVVVGIGVLPFVLAAAWAFSTMIRPSTKQGHAFAVLSALTVAAVTFEATSFNLRFALGGPVQDRYVFYVVPLLFVGMAACLLDQRKGSLAVIAVGGAFAWLVTLASFRPVGLLFFASPDSVWHPVLTGKSWELGKLVGADINATPALVIGTIVFSIAIAVALRLLPSRVTLLAVGLPVLAYCMVETGYVFHKVVPTINHGPPSTLAARDWIDKAIPSGEKVGALVAPINANWDGSPRVWGPGGTEAVWLDTEFWNKAIDHAYLYGGYGDYAPFKKWAFTLDYRTGRAQLPDAPPVIAMSASDVRFALAAKWSKVYASGMMLLRPALPYRVEWATRNIAPDGWTTGGVPAHLRLFPAGNNESARRRVAIIFQSSGEVRRTRQFHVRLEGRTYTGALKVGKRRTLVLNPCVPGSRPLDATITASTPLKHKPPLGMRITRIRVSGPRSRCTPG